MDRIKRYIKELHDILDQIPVTYINMFVELLLEARLKDHQVFVMGNGGSATTASHFVADLGKNTRVKGWPHFRVIGLTDNVAAITAYANDEGFENVFSQQLAGLVRPGDVVIGISTSGNSPNVVNAIQVGNDHGATTVGLTGFNGGRLASLVHLNIHVPSTRIEQIEDVHLMIEHMVITAMKEATNKNTFAEQMAAIFGSLPSASSGREMQPLRFEKKDGKITNNPIELLNAISREMLDPSIDFYDTLQHILQLTVDSIGASSGSFLVLNERGEVTDGLLAFGGKVRTGTTNQLIDVFKQGLAGWVARQKQAALVSNTLDDPRWLVRAWEEGQGTSRSAISVPLLVDDRVMGVMTLVRNQPGEFNQEDLTLLMSIAVFLTFQLYRGSDKIGIG